MRRGDVAEHGQILPVGIGWRDPLEQDPGSQVGRAATPDQIDRGMKIDVGARRELGGHVLGEPGPLELLRPPPLDDLLLGLLEGGVRSRHSMCPRSLNSQYSYSVQRASWFSLYQGIVRFNG